MNKTFQKVISSSMCVFCQERYLGELCDGDVPSFSSPERSKILEIFPYPQLSLMSSVPDALKERCFLRQFGKTGRTDALKVYCLSPRILQVVRAVSGKCTCLDQGDHLTEEETTNTCLGGSQLLLLKPPASRYHPRGLSENAPTRD